MNEDQELMEATRLIDELVGLERFDVIQLPSRNPRVRLYGARANRSMTIGYPPNCHCRQEWRSLPRS